MRTRSIPAVLAALCCTAGAAWAEGGLTVDADELPWPQLQARFGFTTVTPLSTDLVGGGHVQGARVLGDYYFTSGPVFGSSRLSGGFRATSGLLLGSRGISLSMPTVPRPGGAFSVSQQGLSGGFGPELSGDAGRTVPYLGVGYTGLSLKGGWGFTADVGVMAVGSGSGLRLDRRSANQGTEDPLRDVRLTPVLQLGLSYSF